MMTTWHDLNREPVRPSRILSAWQGPQAKKSASVQRERLQQQSRAYEGAGVGRLTGDWVAQNTSADSELLTSLRMMRARSRELLRDNPFAKQAVRIIANNVVGSEGIGMQAQVKNARGKLQTNINDSIEDAFTTWCDRKTCHTAGLLGFADIERLAVVQLVTAGEVIIRKHRQPFGGGRIPLALEVIEADRLLDNWQTARAPNGNAIRMGVEIDQWHRPVAYWFSPQHPGDYQFTTFEPARFMRVPAADILHLYVIERWPQTRGEPWFHAALRSMRDEGGVSEAEIIKVRASANIVGFIRSPEPLQPDAVVSGRRLIDTEPGTWQQLLPGEDVAGMTSYAPNPSLDPFLRYVVRKMGIGIGISYEAISGDRSQSNYSSTRMGQLDDRDLYRVIQGFFCRNFRRDIHAEFCDASALMGTIKVGADYFSGATAKYQAVRFKPRGWSWIDPAKEVAAYKAAVRSGFMTQGDVVAQTANGADLEDVLNARRAELDMAAERDLVFDTDPSQVNDKGAAQIDEPPSETEDGGNEAGEVGASDDNTDDGKEPK